VGCPTDDASENGPSVARVACGVKQVKQPAIPGEVVDIDPGLNPTMGVVDDVAIVVAHELLRDGGRYTRCHLMEMFEETKPTFPAAII